MRDLLVAIAVDMAGSRWFSDHADRMASSLLMGRAGDVRQGQVDGAWLAARTSLPVARPRNQRWSAIPADDGGHTLLAGRIFERDDLRRLLGGLAPAASDADLYAAAHLRFGDDVDRRILGDYAAIRWFPAERRLRLARSAISSHPLHVWRDGGKLVVSSLPRTIFAAGVESRINDTKLADSLLLNLVDPSDSWYRGLSRVAPGTAVTHDPARSETRRFWTIGEVPRVRLASDREYLEAAEEQFRRALRIDLEGSRKPGIMLSGGLDSQAVAAFAATELGPDATLQGFTFVPIPGWKPADRPRLFGDEAPQVRALAAMYPQIRPDFLDSRDARFGEKIDRMFLTGSWPTHNEMTMHNMHALGERASEMGCDLILHGTYGNISFSYDGLTGYPTWLRTGQWARLIREIRVAQDDVRPFWRKLFSRAIWPHAPLAWRKARNERSKWRKAPFGDACPMREDYARKVGAIERAVRADSDPSFLGWPSSRQWREWVARSLASAAPELWLAQQLLYGVEARDPTSFLPLVELCAGMPEEQFLRDGERRWLARRLLKGKVPEQVRTERRRGMAVADWPIRFLRDRDDLLAEMRSMARDPRLNDVFDFERMIRDLEVWDGSDDPANENLSRIYLALGRGVSYARFVRYVEGRNLG